MSTELTDERISELWKEHFVIEQDEDGLVKVSPAHKFARAIESEVRALTSATAAQAPEPALKHFEEMEAECEELKNDTPLERLRYFCSLAMKTGQDWLDIEQFFDAVETQAVAPEPVLWVNAESLADEYDNPDTIGASRYKTDFRNVPLYASPPKGAGAGDDSVHQVESPITPLPR